MIAVLFMNSFTVAADTLPNQAEPSSIKTYLDRFHAIACNSNGSRCLAVGFGKEPLVSSRLVYITEDAGVTWSDPIFLHSPKTALGDDTITSPHPTKISCNDATQRCIIVSAALIDNIPTPIVYRSQDSGFSWSDPLVLLLPKSLSKKQQYAYPSSIDTHVSCDYSGINCVIAATVKGEVRYTPLLYVTNNAGYSWTLTKNLKDISTDNCVPNGTALQSVRCDGTGYFCMAVGFVITKNSFWSFYYSSKPVVYTTEDGGTHWSKPLILPTKITSTNASTLNDVSCSMLDRKCTAIGYNVDFKTNEYQHFTRVTNNGGNDWEAASPVTSNSFGSALHTIKCDETGDSCTAIGWYKKQNNGETIFKPLIYQKIAGNHEWIKNSQASYLPNASFKDLFCNSDNTSCYAVGVQIDLSDTGSLQLHNAMIALTP